MINLLLMVVVTGASISTAQVPQTQRFIPCARAYYERICNFDDDDGVADWITDQLDALIDCNGPNTRQFAEGIASICANDPEIQIYCGEAQYHLPDILDYIQTDCAEVIANDSAVCPQECATSLMTIRSRLGCCINTIFNLTGPDQFTTVDLGFTYSLWSRCNVPTVSKCNVSITYEITEDEPSPDCDSTEQANRVAAAFCTSEENRVRDEALQNLDCANFNLYLDSYCTRNPVNDRYCLTRDGAADTRNYLEPIRQNCQGSSCSDACRNNLREFQNSLGCCLNVVYNQTSQILGLDTFPLQDDSLFQMCSLDTPEFTCTAGTTTSHAQTLKLYGFNLILLLFISQLWLQLNIII